MGERKGKGVLIACKCSFKSHGKGELLEGAFVEGLGVPTTGSGLYQGEKSLELPVDVAGSRVGLGGGRRMPGLAGASSALEKCPASRISSGSHQAQINPQQ